ncbi:MAG: VPLPA-CTERM sorting domain-containing protein [Methylococcaceae bacterium]|nr:VPLPA-CTERM sorting domain-containing protein [Methylococcaceae bacterium]
MGNFLFTPQSETLKKRNIKMKKQLLLTTLILTVANVHVAQASLVNYDITTVFDEPQLGNTTTFTGTFAYDASTSTISNLKGSLSESMTGPPQTLIPLNFQLSSGSDGNGGIRASVFALNTTDVFLGGGFNYATSQKTYGNSNAYVTIDFNALNPTLGATSLSQLSYGDCTAGGMMGPTCMTGHTGPMGGTMNAVPLSETITVSAVPVPAAVWLFGTALAGLGVVRRRKLTIAA